MRFGSVCSGIEAASCAWHPLGWRAQFVSEIEPFPSAVLAHHYPTVPNLGDMTNFKGWPDAAIDLLVGGTPCQSFSVAGLRKGLADPRGNLMRTYLAIAERYAPRWLVWENVPGVLSSNDGRDFGTLLGGLAELGYGFAYRVLDAQFFGVAQRRRRVFVVGHLGDWRAAAAVLFERESLLGHPAPRREAGKRIAATLTRGAESGGKGGYAGRRQEDDVNIVVAPTLSARTKGGGGLGTDFECDGGLIPNIARALTTSNQRIDAETETLLVAHSLRGEGFDASEDGTGRGTPLVPVGVTIHGTYKTARVASYTDIAGALRANVPGRIENSSSTVVQHPIAFAENSRAELRLEGGDGSRTGALSTGGGKPGQGVPMVAVADTLTSNWHKSNGAIAGNSAGVINPVFHGAAVRRLTPRECERLQGFPETLNRLTIRVWKNEEEKTSAARSAEQHSHHQNLGQSAPVGARVLIDLERQVLQLHSLGRLLWSASTAESKSSSLLRMPSDAFAQALVPTLSSLAKVTHDGGEASQPSMIGSSLRLNGSAYVHLCGREIQELASDAERFTNALRECSKFITSETGRDSPNYERHLRTLSSCVSVAISSCIPDSIRTASSYGVIVESVTGYTNITMRGKPAADGPRYKSLGNSMAVPVMAWIGRRIDLIEAAA